jgi:hypothetical protein
MKATQIINSKKVIFGNPWCLGSSQANKNPTNPVPLKPLKKEILHPSTNFIGKDLKVGY